MDAEHAARQALECIKMRFVDSRTRAVLARLLFGLAAVSACKSPTLPPKTIIIPPPVVSCPAAPTVTATSGQSAVATYASATVTGGTAPVTLGCIPQSGSTFPVGSSPVVCTATDAVARTAGCTFQVSVLPPVPRLTVRTILAFGDSITEGEVPEPGEFPPPRPSYVQLHNAYPAALRTLLASRYTTQTVGLVNALTVFSNNSTDCRVNPVAPPADVVVVNAGCLGEEAQKSETVARLHDKISAYRPDLLLLLEGTNDLNSLQPGQSIANGIQGVQRLIRAARDRGVPVMVGTLLPQIGENQTHGGAPELVVPFNNQLVSAAMAAGALRVVDLYSGIFPRRAEWISPYDGLHPTASGYAEMARLWLAAIQSQFESQPFAPPPALDTATFSAGRRLFLER